MEKIVLQYTILEQWNESEDYFPIHQPLLFMISLVLDFDTAYEKFHPKTIKNTCMVISI